MRIETKNKPVDPKDVQIIEDPDSIEVSAKIKELLADKEIDYLPHIPE